MCSAHEESARLVEIASFELSFNGDLTGGNGGGFGGKPRFVFSLDFRFGRSRRLRHSVYVVISCGRWKCSERIHISRSVTARWDRRSITSGTRLPPPHQSRVSGYSDACDAAGYPARSDLGGSSLPHLTNRAQPPHCLEKHSPAERTSEPSQPTCAP